MRNFLSKYGINVAAEVLGGSGWRGIDGISEMVAEWNEACRANKCEKLRSGIIFYSVMFGGEIEINASSQRP